MDTAPQEQARITRHGLYADIRGGAGAPALLFLHGGPGQGCYEFMVWQGGRLAPAVRLVGLDQRGVDRSAPLPDGAALAIDDLVADCEEARAALGIGRWAVLGHSFGGMVALRYAAACPAAVTAVVFENPALDMARQCRAALPHAAAALAALGRDEQARAASDAAAAGGGARALRVAYWAALEALGENREAFFSPNPATRAAMARLTAARQAPPGDDGGDSTRRHHLAITADGSFCESLLPLLPQLAAPALLITGGRDPIRSEEVREAFRTAVPAAGLLEFPDAGHFVHADEPDAYAEAVTGFLRSHRPAVTG
jgi:proline iminopeptidase